MRSALLPLLVFCVGWSVAAGCSKRPTAIVSGEPPGGLPIIDAGTGGRPNEIERRARCTPVETPRKPPLVATLKRRWSAELSSLDVKSQVAINAERVAVSAGATLFLYDRKGALRGAWKNPSNGRISAPTAGADGTFYVASDIAASVDADGVERWSRPLRTDDIFHSAAPTPMLLDANDTLYSLQPDGVLHALRAANGQVLWKKTLRSGDDPGARRLAGGAGAVLVVNDAERGFTILDAGDGGRRWDGVQPDTRTSSGLAAMVVLPQMGIVAGESTRNGLRLGLWSWGQDRRFWLDLGKDAVLLPELVDHHGRLVFLEAGLPRGEGKLERLVTFSCDGVRDTEVAIDPGLHAYFAAFALGADGVTYGLTFPSDDTVGGVRLVAFDVAFRRTGMLEFKEEGVAIYGGVSLVIDGAGILYLALQTAGGTGRLHAVQTTSPGLAATPLSTLRHDAAGTGWAPSDPEPLHER
jgi:hypothetical protein